MIIRIWLSGARYQPGGATIKLLLIGKSRVAPLHLTSFAPEIAAYYVRILSINPVPFRTGRIQ